MVLLQYPKAGYFTDRQRDERYEGPCEADVPEDAVEQYLSRGWERIERKDIEEGQAKDEADEDEIDESPAVTNDREELESMSYNELRKMAADAERDDINGRATKAEIIEAFVK